MAPSYHSKVSSTQNQEVPFFSRLSHGNVLYPHVWVKSKIVLQLYLPILVDAQRLHEKGK